MPSIQVDFEGFGELEKALEKASKQFPYSAEKVLKKESRNIARDLKGRVNAEAKGHHYVSKARQESIAAGTEEKPTPLAESFSAGRVIHSGTKHTSAVLSKAPHYHLYEEGHMMVTHNRKTKQGRSKAGTGRIVGTVKGRKTVARYMAQRSEYSELIGEELLNEILKDAGLT